MQASEAFPDSDNETNPQFNADVLERVSQSMERH
jgi:hypothetical protein